MEAPVVPLTKPAPARGMLSSFVTEQVRGILEERSTRLAVVGALLVVASLFSLVPTPIGVDAGWMFIVPVAIASIAAGLREGLATALAASVLVATYTAAGVGDLAFTTFIGIIMARFVLYGLAAAFLGAFAEAHYQVQSGLRELASIDPLTKVSNVARFYEELGALEKLAGDFAVLVIDMDDLKSLNDRYGHQAGSQAIQTVANALQRVVRGSDCVARFGGDEFVVVLRDADRVGAQVVSNRLRQILATQEIPGAPGFPLKVSIGVAISGEDGSTSEELLAAADEAMYAEKRSHKKVTALSLVGAG